MEDKVSIIVPIYNMENYLGKCIESIIRQSYKNIEIILINDGSTDKSKLICKKYEMKDFRIKVISIKNRGVSNARNLGIKISTGEYISFVDPDDTIDEKYIEEMLTYIKKYHCDVVFCLYRNIYTELNKVDNIEFKNEKFLSNNFYKDFYFIIKQFEAPWCKLYKSSIIKKHNIIFPIDLIVAEDQIFNQEYLKYVKTYGFVNKYLYNYNIRNINSASKNKSEKHFLSDLENIRRKKIFLYTELPLVNKKAKKTYLLEYTKAVIYKYLFLKNISKDELKKIKIRLNEIKKVVELDDLYLIRMNLKECIFMYFLKKNIWLGVYFWAFVRYLKVLIK